jgi:ribosomal protein S24E
LLTVVISSDILHPNRANISKEELRDKLAGMYKASKDQVNVFGLRTQFGGGKTTGFALVYDSPEAMKKFEPRYRLVRVGMATKVEKASRQQRTLTRETLLMTRIGVWYFGMDDGSEETWDRIGARNADFSLPTARQAAQEPTKDSPGYGEGQGREAQEGEINGWRSRHSRPFCYIGIPASRTGWAVCGRARIFGWLCALHDYFGATLGHQARNRDDTCPPATSTTWNPSWRRREGWAFYVMAFAL